MNIEKKVFAVVFLLIAGVVLVSVSSFVVHDSALFGAGVAFTAIGCIRVYQLFRYKTDADYAAEQDIINHDERNLALLERAQSKTFVIMTVGLAASIIPMNLLGQVLISQVISVIVSLLLVTYIVVYWVMYKNN